MRLNYKEEFNIAARGNFLAALHAMKSTATPIPGPAPRRTIRVGRNNPCPCRSGKKFKACCLK